MVSYEELSSNLHAHKIIMVFFYSYLLLVDLYTFKLMTYYIYVYYIRILYEIASKNLFIIIFSTCIYRFFFSFMILNVKFYTDYNINSSVQKNIDIFTKFSNTYKSELIKLDCIYDILMQIDVVKFSISNNAIIYRYILLKYIY